jgi:hypothetical protein
VQFVQSDSEVNAGALFLLVLAEAELFGGLGMVLGLNPVLVQRWSIPVFTGFALAHLLQGLTGECSCGCFGAWRINPWLVLLSDVAAVTALLYCRQPPNEDTTVQVHPLRSPGGVIVLLVVGAAGWWQAQFVSLAGTATQGGQPLAQAKLVFAGDSGRTVVDTDAEGRFHLPLVRAGDYTAAISAPPRKSKTATDVSITRIEISSCSPRNPILEFSESQ